MVARAPLLAVSVAFSLAARVRDHHPRQFLLCVSNSFLRISNTVYEWGATVATGRAGMPAAGVGLFDGQPPVTLW